MLALVIAAAAAAAAAQGNAAAQVEVALDGETYTVHASAQLAADQRVVWDTVTDYERLREFVPGVSRAHVLMRAGNQLIIEQAGVFSVFLVDLPVEVRLVVQHTPYTAVLARMAAGSAVSTSALRSFTARYVLSAVRSSQRTGVRLDYDARFELMKPLPLLIGPLFGVGAVRRAMREQFQAMLREIERRQALLSASEAE